jgi:hypothetical protein
VVETKIRSVTLLFSTVKETRNGYKQTISKDLRRCENKCEDSAFSMMGNSDALLYLCGYLGFYTPRNFEKVVAGEIGGIRITEGFLFAMALWMAIPSVMVFLSLMLKATANRWVNIIAGMLSIIALGATFFIGEISARYTFQAIVEAVLIALILWHAWRWPERESV